MNSPHGIAVGAGQELYLTEFVIGTGLTKLRPTDSDHGDAGRPR